MTPSVVSEGGMIWSWSGRKKLLKTLLVGLAALLDVLAASVMSVTCHSGEHPLRRVRGLSIIALGVHLILGSAYAFDWMAGSGANLTGPPLVPTGELQGVLSARIPHYSSLLWNIFQRLSNLELRGDGERKDRGQAIRRDAVGSNSFRL